ncbi:MAG: uncharacterized protein JWN70_441 [Planctomycetaceae bacterium]|nr:uncharacterized protein [Planctomycetaceae bacterium]
MTPSGAGPKGGQHSAWFMQLWIKLVIQGCVPLSGVGRVLKILGEALGLVWPEVHYTTGRSWILRNGLSALRQRLEQAADWIWIADHSVQIGKTKLLVIVGLRASRQPAVGQALRTSDLQLIALEPMECSTALRVHEVFRRAALRTGCPQAIVSDHGADLLGAVRLWIADHPVTVEIYDVAHQLAALLKDRLQAHSHWAGFVRELTRAKLKMVQTDVAGLIPPRLREKARFMNIKPLIVWGLKMLRLLKRSRLDGPVAGITPQRLAEQLGWLEEFELALREWQEWLRLIESTLQIIRTQGYTAETPHLRDQQICLPPQFPSTAEFNSTVGAFVAATSHTVPANRRLPGSSEVLESLFGKFKRLERQQSKGGFTSLTLGLGVLVSQATEVMPQVFNDIMERTGLKNVQTWVAQYMGTTIGSQRRMATEAAQ